MEFKKGQIVEVVNNDGMAAEVGATAKVVDICKGAIFLQWKTRSNNQMDGMYFLNRGKFKPTSQKGQQLLFSFMMP